ncbi:hypothetical protein RUM44_001330 [Polyplax serrata]|uniref:ATP synthase-coupling factor 6, mitochondrial n=1 Tax=Polyplax serrata TaxID=468196 RepID=A0ABR1AJP6_POLSC
MQLPLLKLGGRVSCIIKRDLGIFVPFMQKASDPIQQLFLDKIRDYKSKSGSGKLVEPSPELQKELASDRERVMKQYGFKAGDDVTKFPSFKFEDKPFENPGLVERK